MSHSDPPGPCAGSPGAELAGDPTKPPPPPVPPPLISARPPQKLASAPTDHLLDRPKPQPSAFRPVYYFFYGTLTKPEILKSVLGLETDVVLREARAYGYELADRGQYKALVDGEPGAVVTGRAYLVQSAEEEHKLAYYETRAYELAPCAMYFVDSQGREQPEPIAGRTFRYAGDAQALKQGRFDPTLWEMQMGVRLPSRWRESTS